MSLTPLSCRSGRFLWSAPVILLLQHIDQASYCTCKLWETVEFPQLQWFSVQKTAVVPQLSRDAL